MGFAQFTYRESLRDIEACLQSVGGKFCHMGFRGKWRVRLVAFDFGQRQRRPRLEYLRGFRASPDRQRPAFVRRRPDRSRHGCLIYFYPTRLRGTLPALKRPFFPQQPQGYATGPTPWFRDPARKGRLLRSRRNGKSANIRLSRARLSLVRDSHTGACNSVCRYRDRKSVV